MTYPLYLDSDNRVAGSVPAAIAPYTTVPMRDGAGLYEIVSITIERTAGVASATVQPCLTNDSTDKLGVSARSGNTIAYSTNEPGNIAFMMPGLPAQFECKDGNAYLAINPSVYGGDTFSVSIKARRLR